MAEATRNAREKGKENNKEEPKEQEAAKTNSSAVVPTTPAETKAFLVTEKFLTEVLGVRSLSISFFLSN